ncbi:MAG TPA: nucleotidyltransferase family protein [Candidatus Eremiobacteraceae bacterium]|nr:nucleotidyltransferase family protein [Candidatus Eremiobacteraceae bacterium]
MWPLLREPMALTLAPFDPRTAKHAIVALDLGGNIVLRRIVGENNGNWLICADAFPLALTTVKERQIIGRLEAVYSDDAALGRPLNPRYFGACSALVARSLPLRSLAARAQHFGHGMLQLAGLRPAFPFAALLDAMTAFVDADWEAFARALDSCSASALIAMALRHGCTGILMEGLQRSKLAHFTRYESLRRGLETSSHRIEHETAAAKKQIEEIVRIFNDEHLPFALLKGSARLFAGAPGMERHPSTDIDILLPADMIAAAADALRRHGYRYGSETDVAPYLAYHHHAAPLVPRAKGLNVELHFALAPPRILSQPLDWQKLAPHIIGMTTAKGTAGCLDPFGSALHLCVHSIGVPKLRDVVLLAQMLRHQPELLDQLEEFGGNETWEPVRFASALALAVRIAKLQKPESPAVQRYLSWLIGREDLPQPILGRAAIVERRFRSEPGRQATQRYAERSRADHWLHPKPEALVHATFHSAVGLIARGLAWRAASLRDRKTYKEGRRSYREPQSQWYNAKSESLHP